MYEMHLVLDGETDRFVEQFYDSKEKAVTEACKRARNAGGTLIHDLAYHPGSIVFADGTKIVGYANIWEAE